MPRSSRTGTSSGSADREQRHRGRACAGDVPSVERRARFQLAAQQAIRAASDAVDFAFTQVGAGAVHSSHPLQRCFRDVHTAAQHAHFGPAALERYAKVRLGIEQPTFMM